MTDALSLLAFHVRDCATLSPLQAEPQEWGKTEGGQKHDLQTSQLIPCVLMEAGVGRGVGGGSGLNSYLYGLKMQL